MNNDVVYLVKDTAYNPELRYSLRSLKNFPHRKVFFFGGAPQGLIPNKRIPVVQQGPTKYDRTHNLLRLVVDDPDLSDDFWLFNDDFFVMRPLTNPPSALYDGTLEALITRIEKSFGHQTQYTARLRKTDEYFSHPLNFEVHVPMLFNKQKLKDILDKYPNYNGVRTIYGALYLSASPCTPIVDPKVWSGDATRLGSIISSPYLSTDDDSFERGKVGAYIRTHFNRKCRYEG